MKKKEADPEKGAKKSPPSNREYADKSTCILSDGPTIKYV